MVRFTEPERVHGCIALPTGLFSHMTTESTYLLGPVERHTYREGVCRSGEGGGRSARYIALLIGNLN